MSLASTARWAGGEPSVLSQKFAEQKCRESTPYFVGNPRQVSNLAVVSFASDADFDTFVAEAVAIPFGKNVNESPTQDTSSAPPE